MPGQGRGSIFPAMVKADRPLSSIAAVGGGSRVMSLDYSLRPLLSGAAGLVLATGSIPLPPRSGRNLGAFATITPSLKPPAGRFSFA